MKKLLYGVGINDADYVVKIKKTVGVREDGRRIQKDIWICPFYTIWVSMLSRCYNPKLHKEEITYSDCEVCEDWKLFSNFRTWVVNQDWEGKCLDKDILVRNNKIYSPDTCVFITHQVNNFVIERANDRGEWPIGVYFDSKNKNFKAQCSYEGKIYYLGRFQNPEDAHNAWLKFKIEKAYDLASKIKDPRVASALIERYENYQTK